MVPTINGEKANDETVRKEIERRTLADVFHEHNQQIHRRMRLGSMRTRSRDDIWTAGERRGGGRNEDDTRVANKTRGNGTDGVTERGSRRNPDEVRNADRASRNTGKHIDGTSIERGGRDGSKFRGEGRAEGPRSNNGGVRGGNGDENRLKRERPGRDGKERVKPKNKEESIASKIVKSGITLLPVKSSASNKSKARAGK